MTNPLARYIQQRRCELGLNQRDLAQALRVARSLVARWETGELRVAQSHLAILAEKLECDIELLRGRVVGAPLLEVDLTRGIAPLDPVECTVEEMLRLGSVAERAHALALRRLGTARHEDMTHAFLRQTPHEYLPGYELVCIGLELGWISPIESQSDVLVRGVGNQRYGGHLRRLALRFESDRGRLDFSPQVPLISRGEEPA
jgi:transcriptional regulator with XRE-family HTH domain